MITGDNACTYLNLLSAFLRVMSLCMLFYFSSVSWLDVHCFYVPCVRLSINNNNNNNSSSLLAWFKGLQPFGAFLHSSYEPDEQCLN